MRFKTKPYIILTRVVRILKKKDQKSREGSERVESISWRNLIDLRLVKFYWLELLKQDEEGALSLVQFLCGSSLKGGHLDAL